MVLEICKRDQSQKAWVVRAHGLSYWCTSPVARIYSVECLVAGRHLTLVSEYSLDPPKRGST
eukprot:3899919-Prymnesium_polylepis.1